MGSRPTVRLVDESKICRFLPSDGMFIPPLGKRKSASLHRVCQTASPAERLVEIWLKSGEEKAGHVGGPPRHVTVVFGVIGRANWCKALRQMPSFASHSPVS